MRVLVVPLSTVVVLAICTTASTTWAAHHHFPNQRQAEYAASLAAYEVITPLRVDRDGGFLSHRLHQTHDAHTRTRRSAHIDDETHDLHYVVTLDGKEHQVSLRPSRQFLAPHAVVERRRGGGGAQTTTPSLQVVGTRPSCHYRGYVANHTSSRVAISTCDGLTGYVLTDDDEYLIEPVRGHPRPSADHPHPHLVYKRSALPSSEEDTCSSSESYKEGILARARWERETRRRNAEDAVGEEWDGTSRRRKRSVSVERNVEVTVVADKKMVDYYSNEDITTYILTVMNMVSSVYHDASIGNAVNIYVVRIMLLEDPQYEEELDISHNADNTLRSFCTWQQMINPGNETHPYHHDVAVLITRYNICSKMTERCSTLGVAEIAGMCQPLRSCNVNEDTGLQIAYTIAHELGHNFGMNHDGPQNGCESQYGVSQHVMSPHLTSEPIPVTWSNCSRQEITHFLDRDWGACLEDEPPQVEFTFPELPPGAMYDADHQCRLSFGQEATHCSGIEGIERVCQTLWCHLDNRCITRMEPAAEGTQCGVHKWCVMGRCVPMGERPAAIHGNWGSWSNWSTCSRTCGAGTSSAIRHCDNPPPANGGRYCTGDRKRYRICNTQDCPDNGVSFRTVQCSAYDKQLYKGALHTWLPVMFDHAPCQLDCKPDNEFYSVKLADTVLDGTPCKPGTRDMCIHGMCKRVTCDWTIEGSAQADRCGVCHGDGTQCMTHRGVFNVTQGSGYVPVFTFPQDATNIKVQEIDDAANYLSVRDNKTGKSYLNGNWIIQWSGEYHAEGDMMYYSREGETEELYLPGPLRRPLSVFLLFQTENPGLEWEYTLPHENVTYTPEFKWEHSDWSVCSVTCGGGKQLSKVQCMEKEAGLVEDKYCINQTRPEDRSRICNTHACPAWWWSGPWQPCSVTCGTDGTRRRTVICVRSFGPTEQMALLDSDCDDSTKPHELEMCGLLPSCPEYQDWSVGPWTQVCSLDPCDYEERDVKCVASTGDCDPLTRPAERRQCGNITCGNWDVGEWSKCSAVCGEGAQFRRVSCIGGLACRERDEPPSFQNCTGECLEEETVPEVELESTTIRVPTTVMSTILIPTTSIPTTNPTLALTELELTTTPTVQSEFTYAPSIDSEDTTLDPVSSKKTLPPISTTMKSIITDAEPVKNVTSTTPIPLITQVTVASNETAVMPTEQAETVPTSNEQDDEDMTGPTVIPTTLKLDNTTLLGDETQSENDSENDTTNTTLEPETTLSEGIELDAADPSSATPLATETVGKDFNASIVNGITTNKPKSDNPSTNETLPTDSIISESENEVDIDSVPEKVDLEKMVADEPSEISPTVRMGKEIDKLAEEQESSSDEKESESEDQEVGLEEKEVLPETEETNLEDQDTIPEEQETILEELETIPEEQETDLEEFEFIPTEQETLVEESPQVNQTLSESPEEERPMGIIEDKINMEDFEVIEVIEIKAEGKRKKDKKKVHIHTGEEAVNVLYDLAEEQASKRIPPTPTPKEQELLYTWLVGEWSECTAECGGGVQSRNVYCLEEVTGSPVNHKFCEGEMPDIVQSCNDLECGEWLVGEWEECSAECDLGERQRSVACPVDKLCPSHSQPPEVEPCNLKPCAEWVEGPWSLCTRSCGGGYQIRHVKCVDTRTQEPARTCPRETKPKHKMSCHNQRCPKKERGQQKRCRDHMDTKLCKRLKHMCSTNFFRIKCCRTCFKKHLLAQTLEGK
ncbi:A disintegrin and metalloproteinase with thrombospondin motifs 6-like [Palaemon carinicauda]|uniref:A disintegrin and metalloproteinase with thrombospondin motifs 6-like n=1 Tax=Palaemon carinicauda TaxID=392227 RepID=UPI0035B6A8D1